MVMYRVSYYFFILLIYVATISSITQNSAVIEQPVTAELELISFSFENRKLLDIIDQMQKLKNVTIILPQGNDALKPEQTVTFNPAVNKTVTVEAAWKLLISFLDIAGYSVIENNKFYTIVKNNPQIAAQVMPIYIVPVSKLPLSQERIRYLYFFKNLKLTDESTKNSIAAILKEMLSPEGVFTTEPRTNAIIITDRADLIASSMYILAEIDNSGFKETIEVIPLYYATAADVKVIFEQLKLAASDSKQQPSLRGDAAADSSTYFASGTVIQADPRSNSLIVMGKESTITRIREFIGQYIDIAPEKGKSVLHVVDLQYLNAQEFAKTLDQIVARRISSDQTKSNIAGNTRTFSPVIVRAEPEVTLNESVRDIQTGSVIDNAVTLSDAVYSGGNRLVIAALEEDWIQIRDLINKLDKPQPQVILEVFIADIRANKDKIIAGTNRNLLDCGIDTGVDYLASHISPVNTVLPTTAASLASDLLALPSDVAEPNVANTISGGSLLISFNETCVGIWGLLQILDSLVDVNVVSRPHLVVLNNGTGKIRVSVIRRALGATFIDNNVPVTPVEDVRADITLEIKPQINSLNQVILEILLNVSEFVAPASATIESSDNRVDRSLTTNAKLNNGQMMILGGLTRDAETTIISQTPIFGQLPLIGWFFRRERKILTRLNLAVFILPTVVVPKLRNGQTRYTEDLIAQGRADALDTNFFENPKDPITRFFFANTGREGNLEIDEYISRASNISYTSHKIITERQERIRYLNISTNSPQQMEKKDKVKNLLAYEDNPLLNHPVFRHLKV